MQEINVTRATDAEARACLALLPELAGGQPELLIARRGGDLAGAAGLVWRVRPDPRGFPLSIHVVPTHRRLGVGRRLLAAAADMAANETEGLWSRMTLDDDAPAVGFLRACGFTPRRQRLDFEAPVEALLSHLRPLLDRLRRRGLGGEATIVPLAEAPREDVAWLVTAELGGDPLRVAASVGHEHVEGMVALIDGRAAGAILWRRDGDLAKVEARVVAAAHRGGPLNLLLLEAGLLAGAGRGVTRLSFYCDDTVRDTLKLAQRCAATQTSVGSLYYYAIAA
ncbi:MAG TPA: GNAT family N-acetyltransferase [Caulobacteraceae bacterium]|jgi:GNAT superfamily N-acetyltransferase|nr:GNAT family N-acetyltransferase [Caulobacteraceae bacterium]